MLIVKYGSRRHTYTTPWLHHLPPTYCASLLCHSLPQCQLPVGVHSMTHTSGSEYVYLSASVCVGTEQYVWIYLSVTQTGQAGMNLRSWCCVPRSFFTGSVVKVKSTCVCVNTCACVGIISFLKGFKGQQEACHYYRGLILRCLNLCCFSLFFFLSFFPSISDSVFVYLFDLIFFFLCSQILDRFFSPLFNAFFCCIL